MYNAINEVTPSSIAQQLKIDYWSFFSLGSQPHTLQLCLEITEILGPVRAASLKNLNSFKLSQKTQKIATFTYNPSITSTIAKLSLVPVAANSSGLLL